MNELDVQGDGFDDLRQRDIALSLAESALDQSKACMAAARFYYLLAVLFAIIGVGAAVLALLASSNPAPPLRSSAPSVPSVLKPSPSEGER